MFLDTQRLSRLSVLVFTGTACHSMNIHSQSVWKKLAAETFRRSESLFYLRQSQNLFGTFEVPRQANSSGFGLSVDKATSQNQSHVTRRQRSEWVRGGGLFGEKLADLRLARKGRFSDIEFHVSRVEKDDSIISIEVAGRLDPRFGNLRDAVGRYLDDDGTSSLPDRRSDRSR